MIYRILIIGFFIGFSIFISASNLQSIPKKHFDLINTELHLRPNWKEHQMLGEAILTLKPYFYPEKELTLDAKKMIIHKVELVGKNNLLEYKNTGSKLIIQLDRTYTRYESIKISIHYTAQPDSILDADGKVNKEEKGLYFINTDGSKKDIPTHLWTQGETQSNSSWFPTLDYPSEKHTQSIKVTYEDKYVSLSNGKLISSIQNENGTKTDHWEQIIPHAVYLTVLVIGDYKIIKDEWRGKEVSYYMEPRYANTAKPIFGRTPEMLEFFSKKLGVDFPWDKYSQVIVHDFTAGAMENTSAVTFNTMFQKDAREILDNNDDETVAHELFHHWFGNIVTCESWTHLTLNESFANYSEYLWTEHKYGKDEAEAHWTRDLAPYFSYASKKKEPLIRYFYKKPDDMFDVISYNKGGKILHMLRNYIGDEAFFKSLQLYLTRHKYNTAEYSDLRQCFEEISGEDLYWFFEQWYDNGGHPILNSHYIKSKDSTLLIISQKHSFDSSLVYRLPLDVDIYTGDIVKRKRIIFNQSRDTFVFYEKDVRAISIDGSNSLVAIKNESRDVHDWLYVLEHSESYLDQSKALKKLNIHKDKDNIKEAIFNLLSSSKPRIINECIKLIDSKWLSRDAKWNIKLKDLAINSKTGMVRSSAIDKLSQNEDLKSYDSIAFNGLSDSSYLVENAALNLLEKIDSSAAYEASKSRIHSNSFSVLNTAFEIISKAKNSDVIGLFENAIIHASGYKKAPIYMNYGVYLANQENKMLNEYLVRFEKMLLSNDEVDNYSARSALKMLKSELVKRDDKTSKARVDEINKILDKEKESEED